MAPLSTVSLCQGIHPVLLGESQDLPTRTLGYHAPQIKGVVPGAPPLLLAESCWAACFRDCSGALERCRHLDCSMSGSTGVVALLSATHLTVANLGDSRCVLGEPPIQSHDPVLYCMFIDPCNTYRFQHPGNVSHQTFQSYFSSSLSLLCVINLIITDVRNTQGE